MQWFLGQRVRSKQGRDQGQYYVIIKAEEKYCYVANGRKTTIVNPKKKNFKHLQGTNHCSEEMKEKLTNGGLPTDGDIREFLNHYQP